MDYITTQDPIIVHDQRPSFDTRPDYLTDALDKWQDAIADYDKLIENEYADDNPMPDYDAMDTAWELAHDLEKRYWSAHARWQMECARRLECTCRPDNGIACPACKAAVGKVLGDEIPF